MGKKKHIFYVFQDRFLHIKINKYPITYILLNFIIFINSLVQQLIFSIISDYAPAVPHPAFKALGNDRHFSNALQKLKRDFDMRCNTILQFS